MDWAQVLVIILSVFLALFLLLAIVLTALLIKLTRKINSVADSAQRTVDSVEKTVVGVASFASPALVAKAFFDQFNKYNSKRKEK